MAARPHRRCLLLFAAAPLLVNARALPEAQQVLDASDALMAKVAALEARNAELEATVKLQVSEINRCVEAASMKGHEAKFSSSSLLRPGETCTIADFLPLEEHMKDLTLTMATEDPGGSENTFQSDTWKDMRNVTRKLELMDANGVTRMAIGSPAPGLQGLFTKMDHNASAVMRKVNEEAQQKVLLSGGRIKALCSVHMYDVTAAVAELNFCSESGFPGVMIHGQERTYVDTGNGSQLHLDWYYKAETLPFWKEVARLGMFVYMHPGRTEFSPEGLYDDSQHVSPDGTTSEIAAYDFTDDVLGCGYAFDTGSAFGYALNVLSIVSNLIMHGLFDEVPDLQMVIGHNGELLPYWMARIDSRLGALPETEEYIPEIALCHAFRDNATAALEYPNRPRQHSFSHYMKNNMYVTTSGWFDTKGLKYLLDVMPEERVLFSADTPYEDLAAAVDWFRSIPDTNPEVSCETLQNIAYKNAEALLKWSS